jgi:hypothetical protein
MCSGGILPPSPVRHTAAGCQRYGIVSSAPRLNIVVIGGLKMAENSSVDLVCENANRKGQRVSVNLSEQTVTFFNCHQQRSGLGVGFEPERVCSFEELVAVYDFLVGEHREIFLRILLMMGRLIHVNARTEDLASIFVSTATGRSRIFATWNGFPELRTSLREIS